MSSERLARFRPLVVSALERAGTSLSEMAGIQIEVTSSSLDLVPLAQVPASAGSAEAVAVGVYVAMTGQGRGHVGLLGDEALVIGTRFNLIYEADTQALDVRFLVVPSPETLEKLLASAVAVAA